MKRFKTRTTIKDVSRRAGVSVGTVSNVTNAPHLVAETTREQVQAVIDEIGYRPSRTARSLPARRTYLIGYRLPTPRERGLSQTLDVFLHELVETAYGHGLEVVLFTSRPGEDPIEAYREVARRGDVDGFVLSETNYEDPRIEYLLSAEIPFVAFGRSRGAERFRWVDVDGAGGVEEAMAHLFDLGHERIAMVAWPEGSESGDDRHQGYCRALEGRGIPYDPDLVIRVESGVESGHVALDRLLRLPELPTAVVCVEDLIAFGLMGEAGRRGVRIGADLAVVGFDDLPACEYVHPRLTSLSQPLGEVGRTLIDLLVDQIENPEALPASTMVSPTLVVRESSGARRA
jgi:DNA-binding LacI/PurR family transcriptional regulator